MAGALSHRRRTQPSNFTGSGFPEGDSGVSTVERVFENLTVFECDSGSDSGKG
jgi:hypothetical protein